MEDRIKVLMICLTRRGGLLHFNDCLAESLGKVCDVSLVEAKDAEHEEEIPNCRCFQLNTGSGMSGTLLKLFSPATWTRLRHIIKETQPDIVHVTSAQEWNPFLGFFIRKVMKKPLIYTIHDVVHHEGTPVYFRITESIFRKMPDAFVVLTEQGKTLLTKKGIAGERILVVPHGTYDFFTRYGEDSIREEKEILFFGRIEPYKGLNILLEAARQVFEKHPDWKLHIAGGGDTAPYEELLKHPNIKLDNRFISDEEVAQFMQRCSIVALPYLSASQSGVIPTAFAFGKAVIATNVGGIPDMVKDRETGLLIPPKDSRSLVRALLKLIENEELRNQLGKNGARFANESLGWASIARKHESFYRERSK